METGVPDAVTADKGFRYMLVLSTVMALLTCRLTKVASETEEPENDAALSVILLLAPMRALVKLAVLFCTVSAELTAILSLLNVAL